MSGRPVTDVAASVRARLLERVKLTAEDPNETMMRYALERFLYRLAASPHAASFLLKGAMLFAVWETDPHRATRDIDLLGLGEDSAARMRDVFADVCREHVPDDGMSFDAASLVVSDIREGQNYHGKRIRLDSRLGTARLKVQVDVGFGDALVDWGGEVEMPTLLDFPAPRLRAYPAEAVIAEKLHAMVQYGLLNSRMKDLYDVRSLAARLAFDGAALTAAIRATFERRERQIGEELPAPLTQAFAADAQVVRRWDGFVRRNGVEPVDLGEVVEGLRSFLLAPWMALARREPFVGRWLPGGPWRDTMTGGGS